MPYYHSTSISELTVGELIAELENYNPDQRVVLYHPIVETYMSKFDFEVHGADEYTKSNEDWHTITEDDLVITAL